MGDVNLSCEPTATSLRTVADCLWTAPFWMKAIHTPFCQEDRLTALNNLCMELRRQQSAGKHTLDWYVEDLRYSAEPLRLRTRLRYRLVAHLDKDQTLLEHITACVERSGYGLSVAAELVASTLYYEEFGFGAVEYRVRLKGADENDSAIWERFLNDATFWRSLRLASLVDNGQLAIQKTWPSLRDSIKSAISKLFPSLHFHDLERFAGWKNDVPKTGINNYFQKEPSKTVVRNDDLLWIQSMDLILFRNPNTELNATSVQMLVHVVHELGLNLDDRLHHISHRQGSDGMVTGYSKTNAYFLRLGGSNTIDAIYSGFAMVALVCEAELTLGLGTDSTHGSSVEFSPSTRVMATRRRMLVNYSILTELADGLRSYLSSMLFAKLSAERNLHELLRRVVATAILLKFDTSRELVEADDIETFLYGSFCDAWGLEAQRSILTTLTRDAEVATSHISDKITHQEEFRINVAILLLTIVTLGGVVSEVSNFVVETTDARVLSIHHIELVTAVWATALISWLLIFGWKRGR